MGCWGEDGAEPTAWVTHVSPSGRARVPWGCPAVGEHATVCSLLIFALTPWLSIYQDGARVLKH